MFGSISKVIYVCDFKTRLSAISRSDCSARFYRVEAPRNFVAEHGSQESIEVNTRRGG